MLTILDLILRGMLALFFAVSGVAKLIDPQDPARFLSVLWPSFRRKAPPVIWALSLAEVILAIGVIFAPLQAASVALLLFVAFSLVLLEADRRGVNIPCGCFGSLDQRPIVDSLRRNLIWGGITLALVIGRTLLASHAFMNGVLISFALAAGIWHASSMVAKNTRLSGGLAPSTRRSFLKLAAGVFLAIVWSQLTTKSASANVCCGCEFQRHYDPQCCGGATGHDFHLHHYWKRCYNSCTGARGTWHRVQPDSCECECYTCSDVTWTENQCCYASECCCNMGYCECGCPC